MNCAFLGFTLIGQVRVTASRTQAKALLQWVHSQHTKTNPIAAAVTSDIAASNEYVKIQHWNEIKLCLASRELLVSGGFHAVRQLRLKKRKHVKGCCSSVGCIYAPHCRPEGWRESAVKYDRPDFALFHLCFKSGLKLRQSTQLYNPSCNSGGLSPSQFIL